MQNESNYKVLEEFVVANSELEELEDQLEKFNIFEAIGVVRQELRHSNFLAFLLDPKQNSGLAQSIQELLRLWQPLCLCTFSFLR